MMSSPIDLFLAVDLKGFSSWEPRTQAIFCIVTGVMLIVFTIALIRKVGLLALSVPVIIIGAMFIMNKNAGCLEGASDVNEAGTYQKGKATTPAK